MLRVSTPGLGGSSSSPQEPSQAYLLQNMVRTDDGVWRPRPGFKLVRNFEQDQPYDSLGSPYTVNGGEIVHLKAWTGDQMFGANRFTFKPADSTPGDYVGFWGYRETNDTVLPLRGVPALGPLDPQGDNGPYGWFSSVQATQSLSDGTRKDMMFFLRGERGDAYTASPTFPYTATGPTSSFEASWVDAHGGYIVACGGAQTLGSVEKTIRWSDYFDPTTWDTLSQVTADHKIGEPIAVVPWQQGISFLIGRGGVGEIQGNSSNSFVFRPTLALPAAPAPNTIVGIGDACFFLVPGPRLVRLGLGGDTIISGPIDRELRALTTLRNLRCWHDSYHNLYCVSDPATFRTYLYSLEEKRWVGHWSRGDDLSLLGEARTEMAFTNDVAQTRIDYAPPFAAIYVAAGALLGRWDPSLTVDESAGADLDIECAVETPPEDAPRMSNYKQLSSVVLNGRGTWTIKLRYRQAQDDSWTDETLGTLSAPGKVYGSLTCYKQGIVRAESTDPTCRFRSLEIQEVDRGGY